MLKKIYTRLLDRLAQKNRLNEETETWCADPLAHPALQNMSLRELADLPIEHVRAPEER